MHKNLQDEDTRDTDVPDIHEILHLYARAPSHGHMPFETSVDGHVLYSGSTPMQITGREAPTDAAHFISRILARDHELAQKCTEESCLVSTPYTRYVLAHIIRRLCGDAQPEVIQFTFGRAHAMAGAIRTATADPSPKNLDRLFSKLKDMAKQATDPRFDLYRTYTNGTRADATESPVAIDAPHKGEDMLHDAMHLALTTLTKARGK